MNALGALPLGRPEAGPPLLDEPDELARFTRHEPRGDASIAVSQLRLGGLRCGACASIVEAALRGVDGVLGAEVSAAASTVRVHWDPRRTRASRLVEAVEQAGYSAAPDTGMAAREARDAASRRALWRLFVAGLCMMQVMMLAAPAYFAAPGDIAPDLLRLLQWGQWLLALPVVLFAADGFFAGAWRSLRAGRIASMDVPVALGIGITFVASSAATFDPRGPFGDAVYFDSLTMFVFFLLAGRWLELRARHRAAAALEGGVERLPRSVLRLDAGGHAELVSIAALRVGDRVRVARGQAFPADGALLEGATQADEALLSGESQPVPKQPGDALVAGSLNLLAPALMRVERLGEDTRYASIAALVRSATGQRPAAVRAADRIAAPFVGIVLVLAAAAAAAWSLIDPSRAVWVAVSVLIVTCPCALSLAVPSALVAAAGALARRGVLLRRLEALETLARIDRVFLDKTGTLTEDRLQLQGVRLAPAALAAGATPERLLAQAAALAQASTHPLSRALVEAAGPAATPIAWREIAETPGRGLQARSPLDGRLYRLGQAGFVGASSLGDEGQSGAGLEGRVGHDGQDGRKSRESRESREGGEGADGGVGDPGGDAGLAVWFGPAGQAWAAFDFEEALRPGAHEAIERLRGQGIAVALLSGDRPTRVRRLAARLGLSQEAAIGAATPEAKQAAIARAQAAGHCVAMVGDGLNDAPVLARADVSFAFAHGADLARAQADAVLLGGRLDDVAAARTLALRTRRVIRQNLAWAGLYNLACIPLALAGALPPWAAGLGMASSSLVVVGNALRLARRPD